jgi:hypothetical protein
MDHDALRRCLLGCLRARLFDAVGIVEDRRLGRVFGSAGHDDDWDWWRRTVTHNFKAETSRTRNRGREG